MTFDEILASITAESFNCLYLKEKAKLLGVKPPISIPDYLRSKGYRFSHGGWSMGKKPKHDYKFGRKR